MRVGWGLLGPEAFGNFISKILVDLSRVLSMEPPQAMMALLASGFSEERVAYAQADKLMAEGLG